MQFVRSCGPIGRIACWDKHDIITMRVAFRSLYALDYALETESMTKPRLAIAIVLAAMSLVHGPALAQSYPTKPIRIVVPYAAGGAVDVVARFVSAKLQ